LSKVTESGADTTFLYDSVAPAQLRCHAEERSLRLVLRGERLDLAHLPSEWRYTVWAKPG
jgi:hypothetical protein